MAIYFGGQAVGDNIQASFTGNTGSGFQSFTLAAWIYVPTFPSFDEQAYVWIYAAFRKITGISVTASGGSPLLGFGNESSTVTGPTINLNQWIHVACSTLATAQTAAKVKGYVNGQLTTNSTTASGAYGGRSAYTMCMGSTSDIGWNPPSGYIEDARFWTRALSAADIMREYKCNTPNQQQLIGWNPLRDTYVRDHSGTAAAANHATWVAAGTAPSVVLSGNTANRGIEKALKRLA